MTATVVEGTVFSYFEVRQMNFLLGEKVYPVKCIGKMTDDPSVKTVSKKCRGVVAKKRTRPTGEGTLNVTVHMPMELYRAIFALGDDKVMAYGQSCLYPEFAVTADVYDEDDVNLLMAWPKCTAASGAKVDIENGGDEVAELELEVGYMPDANGVGRYSVMATDAGENRAAWLQEWNAELVTTINTPSA